MLEGILITGLIRGGVYALLAVGFSLIFGVARMINLAHTCFYMLAAYGIYTFAHQLGLHPLVSIILSLVITIAIGLGTYKLFIDRVREHQVTILLITLALAMVFQECMLLAFGGHYLGAPSFISGYQVILGVKVSYQHLLIFGLVPVVLLGVWVLLSKTRLGIAIRATAQDAEIAGLMGINVPRILLITMGIAAALAAIAGIVVAPTLVLEPHMWTSPLIMIMAIVVLGGLGSVKGSFIAAFIIGYVEVLVVFLLPTGAFLKGAIALLVMVIILLVRPEGLFGVAFEEERL
ncbi:branched-chain amino acid ABC transporter permease [Candidatus Bathyarchaeota archaeon]|nr:MAG: branched-chain amino acid ABC transporter permease [Candidatus Bathyarchaeota archaeon]